MNTDWSRRGIDWTREVFTGDYEYFLRPSLTDERSDAEAAVVARLLGLEPGARVLDAPCGWGRIGNRLARAGAVVHGIDAVADYVAVAGDEAERWAVEARYEVADLRGLAACEEFDAVVNWYTSFGYFDDATNRDVLARFGRALRRGGVLLIELLNRDWLVRGLGEDGRLTDVNRRGDDVLIDCVTLDAETGFSDVERTIVRDGIVRTRQLRLQRFTPPELCSRLIEAEFDEVRFFDSGGVPATFRGPRLIVTARRRG